MERAIALLEHLSIKPIPFDLNMSVIEDSRDDSDADWEERMYSLSLDGAKCGDSQVSTDSCDDSDTMSSIDDDGSFVSEGDFLLDFDSVDTFDLSNESDREQLVMLSESLFDLEDVSKVLRTHLHLNSMSKRAVTLFQEFVGNQLIYFIQDKPSW